MITRYDIDYQRELIRVGSDEAISRVCDMLYTAKQAIGAAMYVLQSDYKWKPSIADVHLSKLGKVAAASILDNIADDMPVDCRRIIRELLAADEESECSVNVDYVLDEITAKVKSKLQECIRDAGTDGTVAT